MTTRSHILLLIVTMSSVLFMVRLVRRRQMRAKYSLLWLSVGFVLVLLAASPLLLDKVSIWFGISYGPATFFMAAITLLFLVVIHFSWELSRLEERTRVLAEELAVFKADAEDHETGDGAAAKLRQHRS